MSGARSWSSFQVLAKRIADLTPENQKTLIMHLRRLAPHCIKVQEGMARGGNPGRGSGRGKGDGTGAKRDSQAGSGTALTCLVRV